MCLGCGANGARRTANGEWPAAPHAAPHHPGRPDACSRVLIVNCDSFLLHSQELRLAPTARSQKSPLHGLQPPRRPSPPSVGPCC